MSAPGSRGLPPDDGRPRRLAGVGADRTALPGRRTDRRDARGESVLLTVPTRTELAPTLRLVAASMGADLGMTADEIDDLRLAVDEVFSSAARHVPNARLSLALRPGGTRLDVTIELTDGRPIPLDDLASTVLHSVVEVTRSATPIRFRKQTSGPPLQVAGGTPAGLSEGSGG